MMAFGPPSLAPSVGVLLAAGRSRRMGRPKLTMAWPPDTGASTVIASAYDGLATLAGAGIVLITNDDQADALRAALGQRPCAIITADSEAPMFESVRAGLRAALRADTDPAGVWLHPGDHPVITPAVRESLLTAADRHPNLATMPTFAGKGGHPVWIPRHWCRRLVDERGEGGLRAVWERYPTEIQRVPVDDASCVLDLDTPEDYAAALRRHADRR